MKETTKNSLKSIVVIGLIGAAGYLLLQQKDNGLGGGGVEGGAQKKASVYMAPTGGAESVPMTVLSQPTQQVVPSIQPTQSLLQNAYAPKGLSFLGIANDGRNVYSPTGNYAVVPEASLPSKYWIDTTGGKRVTLTSSIGDTRSPTGLPIKKGEASGYGKTYGAGTKNDVYNPTTQTWSSGGGVVVSSTSKKGTSSSSGSSSSGSTSSSSSIPKGWSAAPGGGYVSVSGVRTSGFV